MPSTWVGWPAPSSLADIATRMGERDLTDDYLGKARLCRERAEYSPPHEARVLMRLAETFESSASKHQIDPEMVNVRL